MPLKCATAKKKDGSNYVFCTGSKEKPKAKPKTEPKTEPKVSEKTKVNEKEYGLVKKILKELDRLSGRYGDDRDPFGYVKDLIILPKKEGKTNKQIIDSAFKYMNDKSRTSITYELTHKVMLRNLFLELKKLMGK